MVSPAGRKTSWFQWRPLTGTSRMLSCLDRGSSNRRSTGGPDGSTEIGSSRTATPHWRPRQRVEGSTGVKLGDVPGIESSGDKDVELAALRQQDADCEEPTRFSKRSQRLSPPQRSTADSGDRKYIDAHRDRFGGDSICTIPTEHEMPIAPSTYYAVKVYKYRRTTRFHHNGFGLALRCRRPGHLAGVHQRAARARHRRLEQLCR